jgi:hypothetical protein
MRPVHHTLYVIVFSAMLAAYFGLAYLGLDRVVAFFGGMGGVGLAAYLGLKLYDYVKR